MSTPATIESSKSISIIAEEIVRDGAAAQAMPATNLTVPGSISETALDLPADLSFEDWERTGETLGRVARACQWWIGDWLNYGERAYGEKYTQAVEATGYELATLKDFAYVAAHVKKSVRTDLLSFGHHKLLASKGAADQERWLTSTEANGWSVGKLRKELQGLPLPTEDAYTITTERQRLIAKKAKERIQVFVGTVSHAADEHPDAHQIQQAVAAAEPEEIEGWIEVFASGAKALDKLKNMIKAART